MGMSIIKDMTGLLCVCTTWHLLHDGQKVGSPVCCRLLVYTCSLISRSAAALVARAANAVLHSQDTTLSTIALNGFIARKFAFFPNIQSATDGQHKYSILFRDEQWHLPRYTWRTPPPAVTMKTTSGQPVRFSHLNEEE